MALDTATPPKYKLPPSACNCAAHIYGPFDQFPLEVARPTLETPLEAYLRVGKIVGFERGILTQSSDYGTNNACLLDALHRTGPEIKGIIGMELELLTDAEITRLSADGVCGLRINHNAKRGPNVDDIESAAERLQGTGWLLEIGQPDVEAFVSLRRRLEKLSVPAIFSQMGRPNTKAGIEDPPFQELLGMLRDGIVWLNLSHAHPPYDVHLPFAQALVAANPKRCVFGTAWPHIRAQAHPPVPDEGFLLDLLAEWIPDPATREMVLATNPAELYGF